MLGQKVFTQKLNKPLYTVMFNAQHLQQGIYYCTLLINNSI